MFLTSSSNNPFLTLITDLIHNPVVMSAIIAWFIAVIAKAFVSLIANRKLLLENLLGTGGMPSTHTSPVAAMALMVGLMEGFNTTIFAIAGIMMVVVMYDASGIRRAAGRHARAINMIFKGLVEREQVRPAQLVELRELLGHEPIEVAGGAIIGFLSAFYLWAGGYFSKSEL